MSVISIILWRPRCMSCSRVMVTMKPLFLQSHTILYRIELCSHIWEFGAISSVLPKAERKCWLWNCSSMVRGIVGNKQRVEVEFRTHGWNKSESYQKSEQCLTQDSSDHFYSGPGWICYQQKSSCLSAANLHCFILRYQFSFMTIVVTYFSLENYPFHDPHWFYSPMSI